MAKDKNKEVEYKTEGLRRIAKRQKQRKEKWSNKVFKYGRGTQTCSLCGGQQTWCGTCQAWSSYCCCDYGTCQCS